MNKNVFKLAGLLSLFFAGSSFATTLYLTNQTKVHAKATIYYGACSTDRDKDIAPGETLEIGAGLCLVTQIAASMYVPGRDMPATAKPYTSIGTGYRTFAIIQNYDGSFAVIRP